MANNEDYSYLALPKSNSIDSEDYSYLSKPASNKAKNIQKEVLENEIKSNGRILQPQEQFSNPTQYPGFENLSPEEKQQRIGMSAFDPANQSSLGGSVTPGSFENPSVRMAASILPTLALPQSSVGKGLISRYAIDPLLNMATRVGAGTAGNIAYESPNIKSMEDFKKIAKESLGRNTLLEGLTVPLRLAGGAAEMFNPLQYASNKANQIKNELTAMKSLVDEKYKPVNAYNDFQVTLTPKDYLKNAGVKRKDLYPDAKLVYDEFSSEPNLKNLLGLQRKIGNDWARISQHPATTEKAQLFNKMNDTLQNKVKSFLKRDQNALNAYNDATDFTKKNYFPYLATPTLRKIARGKLDVSPSMLAKSIQKGTEKTVGKSDITLIPESHPLRNHLNDLNKMIHFGKIAQTVVPAGVGAIAGELLHPGVGGALGGAVSGLGTSQLAKMTEKFGAPTITGFVQNPLIQNVFKALSPIYYGGGRAAIGSRKENR